MVGILFGRALSDLSRETNRRLGVLVDRKGEVIKLLVGTADHLPGLKTWQLPVNPARLRGLRLIHTSLKGAELDDDVLTALTMMRLDMVAVLGVPPEHTGADLIRASWAWPLPENPAGRTHDTDGPKLLHEVDLDFMEFMAALEEEFNRSLKAATEGTHGQRAVLIGITTGPLAPARISLEELSRLADTAGIETVDMITQRREKLDHRYVTGSGKLREILLSALQKQADTLIFDRELSPAQLRALADETELKVLDRTMLILDIFAQRAKSRDGKIQVELAQLRYRMPRLGQRAVAFSRLTGELGGRGPGETKLEIDRRRARDRIRLLEKKLESLSKQRALRRSQRQRSGIPQVSIVGYTNAGKSTLLNAMTGSDVLVEDKLFATLDTTSRHMGFSRTQKFILADTVGFIKELPKDLKQAFRATLEEIGEAHLVLHVVDAGDSQRSDLIDAVDDILTELSLNEITRLMVFNKSDLLNTAERTALLEAYPDAVLLSAKKRSGLENLMQRIREILFEPPVLH